MAVELPDELGRDIPLENEGTGYFSALIEMDAGTRYRYRLDDDASFPDPASRFQPEGPHGPSELIDPRFAWSDTTWTGPTRLAPVVYELHVGTFTRDGTWRAAMEHLRDLADLGVTMLELMPVSEFPGRFGWGYDGVDLFAPFHHYGRPDDMRAFVDRAHALGLAVILDVVYNHLGPDGNYLPQFSETYFTTKHITDWGEAVNFDDTGNGGTREFVIANATHWIEEYHLDGLRIDATQQIYDDSPRHIILEVQQAVRQAASGRDTWLVAENEPQDVCIIRSADAGGFGLDAAWNDDWHHSALVALSGRDEAYYNDYGGRPSEFIAAAKYGYLYQGQWYAWQKHGRGVPGLDLDPRQFVHFLENHDQVANSSRGDRLHQVATPRRVRALTALLLLGPQVPMLFQGQEFASSAPFSYFADHHEALMSLVVNGRIDFLGQFQSIAARVPHITPADPGDASTFIRSKIDHDERLKHPEMVLLHRDLIDLRRHDPVFSHARRGGVDGAALSDNAFVLRYFGEAADDRLLLIALDRPHHFRIMPEPLLAPPARGRWRVHWNSEDMRYGGAGLPALLPDMSNWIIPGDCAVVFTPDAAND